MKVKILIFILCILLFSQTAFAASVKYFYDASGKLDYIILPTGEMIDYLYDQNGNLLKNEKMNNIPFSDPSVFQMFDGTSQLALTGNPVNTSSGAKTTVQFWMYWDGTNVTMPFSWNTSYDLYFINGYFGFNTGNSDLFGISSAELANKWVHVTAVFPNDIPDSSTAAIYINAVKQPLSQRLGMTNSPAVVTSTAYISGWGADGNYRFKGKIADVRIWDRALTQPEIQASIQNNITGNESGLVGYYFLKDQPANITSYYTFTGGQIRYDGIPVSTTAGAKTTVQFWMYWDGTNVTMPFSWNTSYDLYFINGYFGFSINRWKSEAEPLIIVRR